MSLTELDELLPDNEGEIFKQSEIDSHNTDTPALFKEPGLLHGNEDVIFKQTELLPVHEENLFKQPDSSSQLPFPPLDLPDFSQFPIYDGNFGDLEFLDLASDRFLSKNKNLGQYSDIYFNSLATPSGYCSANYLTEEANRLSLLLESNEKDKGEQLDKTLIENLEELFGVGGNQGQKDGYPSLDEQLPNVLGSLEKKSNYDVEFQVPNDVLSVMAKNLENLEDLGKNQTSLQWTQETPISTKYEKPFVHKSITVKSIEPYDSSVPPAGAIAKIMLQSSKKHNKTKIIFSSIDDKEQHSFSLNTSDMRRAAQLIRYYNLDNMESLRRLLQLGPNTVEAGLRHTVMNTTQQSNNVNSTKSIECVAEDEHFVTTPAVSPPPPDYYTKTSQISSKEEKLSQSEETNRTATLEISRKHEGKCRNIEEQLEKYGIKVHIVEVKLEKDSYFCCPEEKCDKAFISLGDLKLHIMWHYNIKPFQCEEQGCTWSFLTQAKLNRHIKSHLKEKNFTCIYNDCGKQFSNKYNLSVHMKAHGRIKDHCCPVCPEKFDTNVSLELHLSKNHAADANPRYFCEYPGCRFVCFVRNHLLTHSKYHTAQTFPCTHIGCNKVFRSIQLLNKHLEKHLEKKEFVCDFESCGRKFDSKGKLSRHRTIHTKEKSAQCIKCHRVLTRRDHLKCHDLTFHAEDKPLRCLHDSCDKKFAGLSLLMAHMRKVHKKKNKKTETLTCPVLSCGGRFLLRSEFEFHLTEHAKEKDGSSLRDSIKDATNLDFVALLSSVGEDILLPDQLSCPEYEISTVPPSPHLSSHQHKSSFNNGDQILQDVRLKHSGFHDEPPTSVFGSMLEDEEDDIGNIVHQHQTIDTFAKETKNINLQLDNCDTNNVENIQSFMIPKEKQAAQILISIPQDDDVTSELKPVRYENIQTISLTTDSTTPMQTSSSPPTFHATGADMTEILIDGINISDQIIHYEDVDGGAYLSEAPAAADLNDDGAAARIVARVIAAHSQNLNHSTINLQDLK